MTGANLTFILTSIITCDNFIKFGGCVYWRQKCLCVFLNAAFEPNINRALRVPDGWGNWSSSIVWMRTSYIGRNFSKQMFVVSFIAMDIVCIDLLLHQKSSFLEWRQVYISAWNLHLVPLALVNLCFELAICGFFKIMYFLDLVN